MSYSQPKKKNNIITIKYDKNYNNKFYGKYFASIRPLDFNVQVNSIYEIEVNDKIIGTAKLIKKETHLFHEIPSFQMSLITGMNHADSLQHYFTQGLRITSFDLMVNILMFEILEYYPKRTT